MLFELYFFSATFFIIIPAVLIRKILIWNKKCKECEDEELVAFQFHFSTDEWEDVKKELSKIPLSEDNMMRRKLGDYSFYEFFDGHLSFEKKSLL